MIKICLLFEELRKSISGKGLGMFPIYSAVMYFSVTKHRGISKDGDFIQDQIQKLKDGNTSAIEWGADLLSKHPGLRGFNGVVIGAPRSKTGKPSNLEIAKKLVSIGIGKSAESSVSRIVPVESSRIRRRRGERGTGYREHLTSMSTNGVPQSDGVLIVDDVFTTGATIRAAGEVLWKNGFNGPIFGATVAYYNPNPLASDDPNRPAVFYV